MPDLLGMTLPLVPIHIYRNVLIFRKLFYSELTDLNTTFTVQKQLTFTVGIFFSFI